MAIVTKNPSENFRADSRCIDVRNGGWLISGACTSVKADPADGA
jgi:hypothetical protein